MNLTMCSDKKNRILIYLYFFFIFFDGILRKWLLFFLSTPIMFIKQIIAILICIYYFRTYLNMSSWEKAFMLFGTFAFLTSLLVGHQNIIVAIYGSLPYWFGLPVCYIIGKKLKKEDLFIILKIIIWASIINSLLIIIQFNLPTSHFLNFSGGDIDDNIANMTASELSGSFRPYGIFMHSTHTTQFMLLSFGLTLYSLFIKRITSKPVTIIALLLGLLACICSASRSNIFTHIGMFIFFAIYCMINTERARIIKMLIFTIGTSAIISLTPIGEKALENLSNRFDIANDVQYKNTSTTMGTLLDIWDRNITYNLNAIFDPHTIDGRRVPFWGYGQGLSTQIGGKILNIKTSSGFSLAEWDGLRIMCESGYILGWLIIYIRIGYILRFAYYLNKYKKKKYLLTICLFPTFFIGFYLITTWGNLFLANFAFFTGGLFLASLRMKI